MTTEKTIAASIDYLVAHYQDEHDLKTLAARFSYEPTYFQKLFKSYTGLSPKRLAQVMTFSHARDLLTGGETTLETAYAAGLSGNGRLHDLCVTCEAATPGEMRLRGQGLRITYGFFPTPLGEMMLAATKRGLCWAGFQVDESRAHEIARARRHWPKADFAENPAMVQSYADQFLQIWKGAGDAARKLPLDLYGTNFQLQVWRALLRIPGGEVLTYQDIAQQVGRPAASRAVGNAVGANPVSLLIPCHRVIRATGIVDNYGWGSPRKKMILAVESRLYRSTTNGRE